MAHNTELVAWKKLSNGQHAVCIRCCGDEGTDHWHGMNLMATDANGILQPVDPTQRDANLAEMHKFVAAQHEEMQKTAQQFLDKAGQVIQHG